MTKETEAQMTDREVELDETAAESLKPQSHAENDPKSKVQTLSAMVGAANCLTNQELTKWYTSMIDLYPGVVKAPGSADSNRSTVNMKAGGKPLAPMAQVKIKEDMDALFEGDESLTEEAREKITTLFEAAVNVRVGLEVAALEEEYEAALVEEVEQFISETDETISAYLDNAVERWLEENEVAVVDTLRLENAEEFMDKLKGLFVESYFDIPEERVDVVNEMTEYVEDVEGQLSEALNLVAELKAQIDTQTRESVLESSSDGLTLVDSEKLKSLTESIEFVDSGDFEKKVSVIKEKYFPGVAKPKNEGVETLNEQNLGAEERTVYVDPLIEAAVRAMDGLR